MHIEETKFLSFDQKAAIVALWNNEYPRQLKYGGITDFDKYLGDLINTKHLLLMTETKIIKGWYAQFIREDEIWFSMILNRELHGKGFGTQMLQTAKNKTHVLNGWVIDHDRYTKRNGEKYISPLAFYLKNGFELLSDTRLELYNFSAVKIRWMHNPLYIPK